jgi:hypothetical protein
MKEKYLLTGLIAKTESGKIIWHRQEPLNCYRFLIHGMVLDMLDDGTMALYDDKFNDIGFAVNVETLKENRERLRSAILEQESQRTDGISKLIALLQEL